MGIRFLPSVSWPAGACRRGNPPRHARALQYVPQRGNRPPHHGRGRRFFLGPHQVPGERRRGESGGIQIMFYGVLAIFVMVSIWGVVGLLQSTSQVTSTSPVIPQGIQIDAGVSGGGGVLSNAKLRASCGRPFVFLPRAFVGMDSIVTRFWDYLISPAILLVFALQFSCSPGVLWNFFGSSMRVETTKRGNNTCSGASSAC